MKRTLLKIMLCHVGLLCLKSLPLCAASHLPGTQPIHTRFQGGGVAGNSVRDQAALLAAVRANEVEAVRRLLAQGADINSKDDEGFTPLMIELQKFNTVPSPLLMLILQHRPDFSAVSHDGANLWHCIYWMSEPGSVGWDKSAVVRALLAAGVDINKDDGRLLGMAAFHGDTPMIKMLIEQGIDLPRFGGKALDTAAFWGENIRANPPVTTIRFLVDHGAYRPDDPDSRRAFRTVAYFGDLELTRQMIARGAAKHKDDLSSALIGASGGAGALDTNWGSIQVVKLLLQHGADPNGPPGARGEPLLYALRLVNDGREIVRVLVQHGARVHFRDKDRMGLKAEHR